ncbi:hypothetical protein [Anthocerotibacter panamensis]|uniref:hypothetical protein n=1 Tax=Anthocerotibacter panamensis TaxID=2857077 RepID=UPI001C402155|nr:hypothetical protein [Anthocerotibacter panamensis]
MSELSDEKKKILEHLLKKLAEQEAIPESERYTITNPDKYSFPLGMDDQGVPFREEEFGPLEEPPPDAKG